MEPLTYSVTVRTGQQVTVVVLERSVQVDVDGVIASVTRTGRAAEHSDAPLGTRDPAKLTVVVDGATAPLRRRGRWKPLRRSRGLSAKVDAVEYAFAPRTMASSVLCRDRMKILELTLDGGRVRVKEAPDHSATELECALAVALAAAVGCGELALASKIWRAGLELLPFWP